MVRYSLYWLIFIFTMSSQSFAQRIPEGTEWISTHGYSKCIRLFNETTSVVLEPNCGGRVLEYSLNGHNVLLIDPRDDGWTIEKGTTPLGPCAGRFDFGPETTTPSHPDLWLGRWMPEITGTRSARMTSAKDKVTGVQLTREFTLAKNTSFLRCTQIITNVSDTTKQYFHWSRTFAEGNGICVVPITPGSRFPKEYIIYGPGNVMNFRPDEHPNVRVRDGYLEIIGEPPHPKFGFDSSAGWFAYLMRSNIVFLKKFPVYPDRVYGEMAGLTISIFYYKDLMTELEPIGPRETLKPGESVSFSEDWWLFPYTFPEDRTVDLKALEDYVMENSR